MRSIYYKQHEVYDELAGSEGVFSSRLRLLVFSACVGYANNERVPVPGEEDEESWEGETKWEFITQDPDLSVIISALTYAATDDPESIMDDDKQIDVLLGFGAGGAEILQREVVDASGDNLDNMIEFLKQHRDEDELTRQVGVLEEIEREVSGI